MKLDYQDYLSHPELRSQIEAEARRERALVMDQLVFAPIAGFFRRPTKAEQLRVAACH